MNTGNSAALQSAGSVGDVAARIERLPISRWHIKVRLILGLATFFDAFDVLALAYVLPVLIPLWKISPAEIGFLISAGFVGQLFGALTFGWIAERYGRRPAVLLSILTFSVMSLACAFAWDYSSLLVMRTIQGFGLGGEVPIAMTFINEISKAKNRGRFVILFELTFPIGLVAAALFGWWIVPILGWQAMFMIGALPALLCLILTQVVPESPRWLASRGRSEDANATLSLIEKEIEQTSGRKLPAPVSVDVVTEQKASLRDMFGSIYLRRTLVIWLCWFATYLCNYSLVTWLPSIYRSIFKLPLEMSLRYSLITSVFGILGGFICAMLVDTVGRRTLFGIAFLWASIALSGLWFVGPNTAETVLIGVTIAYVGITALSNGLYLYTPELYPTRVRALAVSTATAWLRLASIIGPVAVGFVVAQGGLNNVFLAFSIVAAIGAFVVIAFGTETKSKLLEEVSP